MNFSNLIDSPFAILVPAACMALWCASIVLRLGACRYFAIVNKRVKMGYYKLYIVKDADSATNNKSKIEDSSKKESAATTTCDGGEPLDIAQISQHVENLFETPQLFYAACAFLYLVGDRSAFTLGAAWAYFVARLAHSFVSLGSNNVTHRFQAFGSSIILVICLWVRVLYAILTASPQQK